MTLPVVAAMPEQVRLGWEPDQISLLGEIEHDNYFQRQT